MAGRTMGLYFLAWVAACAGFQHPALQPRTSLMRKAGVRMVAPVNEWDSPDLGEAKARIEALIKENKVMVFMKGSKLMPQCGFSNAVVQVFNSMKVPFATYDVLSDPEVRQSIKEYSDWPTIPQVYVDSEFIGGCDIVVEMYQSGELQEMVERAVAE